MVTDLVSVPLSWSDHHLIKCNLSVALPPCKEQRPILMVHPLRLLDPIGFQDSMRGIPADLTGAPVKALGDGWLAAATRAIDMITPKHPLHCRARPALWFNHQLQSMKWNRRRLESAWRQNPMENNLKVAKVISNL